jgi:hypothetical protein
MVPADSRLEGDCVGMERVRVLDVGVLGDRDIRFSSIHVERNRHWQDDTHEEYLAAIRPYRQRYRHIDIASGSRPLCLCVDSGDADNSGSDTVFVQRKRGNEMRKQILSSILLALGAVTVSHLGGWWWTSLMGVLLAANLVMQDILANAQQKLIDILKKANTSLIDTCDGYQKLVRQYREMWTEIVGEMR